MNDVPRLIETIEWDDLERIEGTLQRVATDYARRTGDYEGAEELEMAAAIVAEKREREE